MRQDRLLKYALAPSIIFLLLSLISVALTVHYWILGDWILTRGVEIPTTDFDQQLQQYKMNEAVVWYTDNDTNATIASGCLNLAAAIIALMTWTRLRKAETFSQHDAGKRLSWIITMLLVTISGAVIACSSFALHYTEKGSDQYGCESDSFTSSGVLNTNMYCTREMGACNFLPKFVKGNDRANASLACAETMTVKWVQILLFLNACLLFGIFASQAYFQRKSTRATASKEVYSGMM